MNTLLFLFIACGDDKEDTAVEPAAEPAEEASTEPAGEPAEEASTEPAGEPAEEPAELSPTPADLVGNLGRTFVSYQEME